MKLDTRVLAVLALPALSTSLHAQTVVYEELYAGNPSSTPPLGIDDVEVTPDGRYAVARDNTSHTSARIYDLENPAPPTVHISMGGSFGGAVQDGVAVTNERAIVIGSTVMILDLTQQGFPVLMEDNLGDDPRDVVITPDGTLAIVRGGDDSSTGIPGGSAVYDLANATRVAFQPGQIGDYFQFGLSPSVDTVVADNTHAVTLSLIEQTTQMMTRITVWDLQPAGGGSPVVAFETGPGTDLPGEPLDLALAPDGQHAAVRSAGAVARLDLAQSASGIQWVAGIWGAPGPQGGTTFDYLEMNNEVIFTISRRNTSQGGMQVDFWDSMGNQSFHTNTGDAHDLEITPDGRLGAVRTEFHVQLFDLTNLPQSNGTMLDPVDIKVFAASTNGLTAGLDSLAITDTRVVAIARQNANQTRIRAWDISGDTLEPRFTRTLSSPPLDIAITPDESKILAVGIEDFIVIEMATGLSLLEKDISILNGGYSWCDGAAISDGTAIAFGSEAAGSVTLGGWLTLVDLFNQPVRFCGSTPNSTGVPARIAVTGSADSIANNLRLLVTDLPSGEFGAYFYGDVAQSVPFGNGFSCVGGQVAAFPVQVAAGAGNVSLEIDNASLPAGGGALAAGSSWNFQYVYRDSASTMGAAFNTSDALTVTFE